MNPGCLSDELPGGVRTDTIASGPEMNEDLSSNKPPAQRRDLDQALADRAPATAGRTQDIDRHVGARVRERRIMMGLTQQQLADLIGVTYQQAHKYERGINRVSAGRLYEIAQVL